MNTQTSDQLLNKYLTTSKLMLEHFECPSNFYFVLRENAFSGQGRQSDRNRGGFGGNNRVEQKRQHDNQNLARKS